MEKENKVNVKLYDLEISLERLQGLKDTLEQLLEDNSDIKVNAIVVSIEREIKEATKILNDIEHEAMKKDK